MLTKPQLEAAMAVDNASDASQIIAMLLAEVKAQREVIFAALGCTGEDGHDGMNELNIAAEEYLEKLGDNDPRWRTATVYENIQRVEAE